MKAAALILAVALSAAAQTLTPEGQSYKPVLDSISAAHARARAEHDRGRPAPTYDWRFVDASQYPFWCADTNLSGRVHFQPVIATQDGLMIRRWSDALSEHVQVATVSWIHNKQVPQQRTFRMWLFVRGGNGKWRAERPPVQTTVNLTEGRQGYYCQ